MSDSSREISPVEQEIDRISNALRPLCLNEFIGQKQLRENLGVFIEATKTRGESLDHTLFHGPPGLGKTTLAQIIAYEMGVGFKSTAGPAVVKTGDLAAILTNLQTNDILFIDEIHRLPACVEEVLYSAMEDFKLDIIIGEGPAARTIKINLPQFTLVGATTRLGLLTKPLRDRFGIPMHLDFYSPEELEEIIVRGAGLLEIEITKDGAQEIATRARGTPRIAIRLLRRIRDFATVDNYNAINAEITDLSLRKLDIDDEGLDTSDRRYLRFIADNYQGGPVGIDTIVAGLADCKDAIEETIEPYLLQKGFLSKTPRGRVLTEQALKYLNILTED